MDREWLELRDYILEARLFAMEARDLSLANRQTLEQVISPALEQVQEHEAAINKVRGVLWTFGVVGGLLMLASAVFSAVAAWGG